MFGNNLWVQIIIIIITYSYFFFFLSFIREQFFFSADNDCDEGNELTLGKITFWETKLKKKINYKLNMYSR